MIYETQYKNIWDVPLEWCIVIPTNIGWTKDRRNVMGRGIAKQAATKWPGLPYAYGQSCANLREATPTYMIRAASWYNASGGEEKHDMILFPVKPLNSQSPHLSWRGPASLELIERSLRELIALQRQYRRHIALPLVGCGNGKLHPEQVLPLLEQYLVSDDFHLVDRQNVYRRENS